jgi:hypothetical protein
MKNFPARCLVRDAVMVSAFLMLVLTAPGAQLDYGVAPGLRGCPDEAWIRSAVSARLGRDPFSAEGEVRVVVRISQVKAPALVGQVELTRADGRVGRRSVESETGDCMELASALELAVSLALDPLTQSLRAQGDSRGEPQPASAPTPGPEMPPLVTPLPNPLPLGGEGDQSSEARAAQRVEATVTQQLDAARRAEW